MSQLLIIGYSNEGTIIHFTEFLDRKEIDYDFLDLSEFKKLDAFSLNHTVDRLAIQWGEKLFDLSKYQSFYCRCYATQTGDPLLDQALLDLTINISAFLEGHPGTVVNRISGGTSNGNKIIHLEILREYGFQVPVTYIIGSSHLAEHTIDASGGWVSKSNSGVKTESVVVDEALFQQLELIEGEPTTFQQKEDGADVRVHLVGDKALGLEIVSDKELLDYRFAGSKNKKNTYRAIEVPDAILDSCKNYCKDHNLNFCGFDFKIQKDKWVILEANPMPGYDFFDTKLEFQISEALLGLLLQDQIESKESSERRKLFVDASRRPTLPDML